jgi:hypothetical protein
VLHRFLENRSGQFGSSQAQKAVRGGNAYADRRAIGRRFLQQFLIA